MIQHKDIRGTRALTDNMLAGGTPWVLNILGVPWEFKRLIKGFDGLYEFKNGNDVVWREGWALNRLLQTGEATVYM
jgi:hypothetical protein